LVRGISQLPNYVINRVQAAHTEADALESYQQSNIIDKNITQKNLTTQNDKRVAENPEISNLTPQAIDLIQKVFQKLRDNGRNAYIVIRQNKITVVIGTQPGSEQKIDEIIDNF
jgi:hypothetical protein